MNTAELDEIRQGNPETMTTLLEQVAPVIKSVAARFKLDPDSILQEVSLQLLRDPGRTARLTQEGTLQSWCRVVSRNMAMHQLRRIHKDTLPDVLSDDEPVGKSAIVEPIDTQKLLESAKVIGQLLSSLDEVDQEIIKRHYADEMTFDEIAELLSLELNRVRQRAYRAMAKLRYNAHRSMSDKREIR